VTELAVRPARSTVNPGAGYATKRGMISSPIIVR